MGQTRLAQKVEKIGDFTADELKVMIKLATGSTELPTHPNNALNSKVAAENTLKIYEILKLVQEKPAKGRKGYDVYDMAVLRFGGEDRGQAIESINRALLGSIKRLSEVTNTAEDAKTIDKHKDKLLNMIIRIAARAEAKAEKPEDAYFAVFSSELAMRPMNRLRRVLLGAGPEPRLAIQKPGEEGPSAAVAGTEELIYATIPMEALDHIFVISESAKETIYGMAAKAGDEFDMLFGGDADAAQNGLDQSAAAFAAEVSGLPNDVRTGELLDALEKVTHPLLTDNEDFKAALDALRNGDRATALQHLRNLAGPGGPLRAFLEQANNMHIVTVRERAFSVIRAGVDMTFSVRGNMKAFRDYLASMNPEEDFDTTFLGFAVGFFYDNLLVVGEERAGEVDLATGKLVTTGEPRKVVGRGDAGSITIKPVILGTSIGQQPIKITFHCNVGYKKIDFEKVRAYDELTGTTREIKLTEEGPYIGYWGIEVETPERKGAKRAWRIGPIDVEKAGIAAYGIPENLLGYATFSYGGRAGVIRYKALATPMISYLARKFRAGGDVSFILGRKFKNDMQLFGGPGVNLNYNSEDNILSVQPYGVLMYTVFPGLDFILKAGVFTEVLGDKFRQMPTAVFFGGYAKVAFPEAVEEAKARLRTVPVPVEGPIVKRKWENIVKDYRLAVRLESAKEKSRREDMAGRLGRTLMAIPSDNPVAKTKSFKDAIKASGDGDLKKMLASLRKLKLFRELEGA